MEISGHYLTYTEYKALGGTLLEMPFNLLEFEARKEIDKYTFGRLINLDSQVDEVKLCVYNLINTLQGYESNKARDKAISSEQTDGYSVSYGNADSDITKTKEAEVKNVIKTYLSNCKLENGTPYLYRGIK